MAVEYREVSFLLPWLVLSGGIFATGQMLALKLMSDLKSSLMLWPKIITAILGVVFNLFGALVAGLQGVVGALLAFSIIYLTWFVWLAFHAPANSENQ